MFEKAIPPKLLAQCIDTLHVAYWCDFTASALDFEDLAFRKERLTRDPLRTEEIVTIGGRDFLLKQNGSYPYKYVLECEDFKLRLAETMQPSLFVHWRSRALWQGGAKALITELENWLTELGVRQTQPEKVSRADFAFDFHLQKVDFDARSMVSRLKKSREHRESQVLQTISFGTGDVVVRIYDKTAEIIQSSGKTWLYDIWGEQTNVWRVEFQLRGEAFKGRRIRTLEQLWSLAPDTLLQLAEQTSLRSVGRDTNRSRWKLHPLWLSLLEAIEAMPRNDPGHFFECGDTIERRLRNIQQQIHGLTKAHSALQYLRGREAQPASFDTTLKRIGDAVSQRESDALFVREAMARAERYRLGEGL